MDSIEGVEGTKCVNIVSLCFLLLSVVIGKMAAVGVIWRCPQRGRTRRFGARDSESWLFHLSERNEMMNRNICDCCCCSQDSHR